jgi:cytoskeletal protein CcmA (bactofilin family)
MAALNGFLGKGTVFEGILRFEEDLRIEGTFRGQIEAPGATLTIGESAEVEAEVSVGEVLVAGRLSGEVQATRRFEITPKGQVYGRVTSPTVVVRDGGTLDGECAMAPAEAPPPPAQRQASPQHSPGGR